MVVQLTAYLFVWMGRQRAKLIILLLVSCLRISVELPHLPFARSLVRLWLECQTFMFIVIYPLLDFICWDYDYVFETWGMMLRFYYSCIWGLLHVDEILCLLIFRCEFYETKIMHVLRKWGCSILSSLIQYN